MFTRAILLAIAFSVAASTAFAGPVLKPRKYHGPIPQSALSLRVGFLSGPSDEEMIDYLDGLVTFPEEASSEDFGNGLTFELTWMKKPHPQFGVRANIYASFLESTGQGFFVDDNAQVPDSVPKPVLDYQREFKTDLYALELSAMYFFSDASVNEFQLYLGGGFTFGFPYETFTETRTDRDTGAPAPSIDKSQWSFSPGVHAVLGGLYYLTNKTAVSVEGRVQTLQNRFPLTATNEFGQPETVNFVVDYTGFFLTAGIARGF